MSEGQLWSSARPRLAPYGRLTRIENRVELGTPDVNHTLRCGGRSMCGWTELKHAESWPMKPTTKVCLPKLFEHQVEWLEEEHRVGGIAHVFLQAGRDYLIIDAKATRMVYERLLDREELKAVARLTWRGEWPMGDVLRCLTSRSET